MGWIGSGFALVIVLVLGIGRLALDERPSTAIDQETAAALQSCLGPGKDIAANTAVTVPVSVFEFVAIGPVQVELNDVAGRNLISTNKPFPVTTDQTVTVSKGKGDFEFSKPKALDKPMVVRVDDSAFAVEVKETMRFGPADRATYPIKLSAGSTTIEPKADANGKFVAILPAGSTGLLSVDTLQVLVPLQPLATTQWLKQTPPSLIPVRTIGQQGLSDFSIEARQPGLRFDDTGFALAGCARLKSDPARWVRVGITDVKAAGAGAATVRLSFPSTVLPAGVATNPIFPLELTLSSLDGRYRSYGGFTAVSRLVAAVVATVLVLLLFIWLSRLRGQDLREKMDTQQVRNTENSFPFWFSSLFVGADKEPSLSLFQVFFWTVITVWGFAYVYVVTGSLLSMTASMMTLLGIAGTGSVLARWIAPPAPPSSPATQAAVADTRPARPFEFWQMLSTNGNFDLLKLQLFVFTLMIGLYVVWRIADTGTFPELDPNTLLLLGVSQGVYIGGKLAGSTTLARAQTFRLDIDVRKEALAKLKAANDELKKKKADLEAEEAAATAAQPFPADKKKTLTETSAAITANNDKLKQADEAIKALEAELLKLQKELGLVTS